MAYSPDFDQNPEDIVGLSSPNSLAGLSTKLGCYRRAGSQDCRRQQLRAYANAIIILTACIALKVILAFLLYDPAGIWLHEDDYCRALMAQDWGHSPYLYPTDLHWLPLPFYIYGLASRVGIENQQLLFVVVSQVLSACTLLAIYGIGRAYFSRRAALLGAVLYTFTAWQLVMSFSSLAEPVYYLVTCCGVWAFSEWWKRDKPVWLMILAVCMALAAITRYEAWLFLLILGMPVVFRSVGHRTRRPFLAVVLAAAPCLVPAFWILANLSQNHVPLAFYTANRQAFSAALYELTPVQRVLRYPTALLTLSIPLTMLLVLVLARPRAWGIAGRAQCLVVITAGHLVAMIALYTSGSGPSFVERIVLLHLFLLLPLGGAGLAAIWNTQRPLLRASVLMFLAAFIGEEYWRARQIINTRQYNDYAMMGNDYQALSTYLRMELPSTVGDVAVQCHDDGYYVRFSSNRPGRVHAITDRNMNEVLSQHNVALLCVPMSDIGPWRVDERVEPAFLLAHQGESFTESQLGNWRIIRATRKTMNSG